MAIPIPISRTKIATAPWGIPITNEVNRLTTQSDTNKSDITALKAATAVTAWTGVTFQNGFSNFGGGYQACQYRKVGDIVYCRGTMTGGTVGTTAFTLPTGFRPVLSLGFPGVVFTTTRQVLLILVSNTGTVNIYDYVGNIDINTIQFSITA